MSNGDPATQAGLSPSGSSPSVSPADAASIPVAKWLPGPVRFGVETRLRDDIRCPKSGEMIPLDNFSISKWSATHYHVFCPDCDVWHGLDTDAPKE